MSVKEIATEHKERLEEGDWIVHKQHGVGQVKAIEKKKIGGKERKYFRVKVSDGVYWLPIKKAPDYIRSIASRYRIRKVLKSIRKAPQDLPDNYKERNEYVVEKLTGAKLQIKGEIIRDLHARGPNEDVNLTVIDSRQLDKLREQFLREMMIVLDIDMAKAEEKLDRALRKSVERMKKNKKEERAESQPEEELG
ncbi:MAG: hypothetical protein HN736_15975 [Anaerolineae bacterium]|jgi:RNA polymerase-interacting CarD/CdnL/TRCF family regulator|nr:hypothetical protein [Anaerolineae bacterium]MBT3712988.1 hypothetical protein [Anaerolineae bacterium]MBT4311480.1 hypothetical protein [Anaerolineae bacterium]MBT4458660.1 hypothetical protein [Anaerolineae bacterium]MBT6062968.1 hypothetical protein [Anaerolineae bacterium]